MRREDPRRRDWEVPALLEAVLTEAGGWSLMRRRRILTALLLVLAAPPAARAQQPAKPWRIGWLSPTSLSADAVLLEPFRQGLQERGLVESRNVAFEFRWAEGKFDRLPELATELVRSQVDVIVALLTQASLAAKTATSAIPIVMIAVADPVGTQLVASLSRPGGNLTGTSSMSVEVAGKSLEILKQVAPAARRVAVLWNPSNAVFQTQMVKEAEAAARALGFRFQSVGARDTREIDVAFEQIIRERAEGLTVLADPVFAAQQTRIVALASKARLPSVSGFGTYAEAGGLVAYGPSFPELSRRAATYVDKILKGAKPADLPVEQPTKFELVINLKTAKALGLTIPPSLLLRADQVIE